MPDVCDLPTINVACDAATGATHGAADSAIEGAANAFAEALGKLTATLLTFWTNVGLPDLNDPSGPVAFIQDSTSWLTAFVLVLSLLIAGGKMAIQRNFEAGQDAAKGVWQMVFYAGAGVPGIALLGIAGDQFSQWIIDRASGGDLGARLIEIFSLNALNPLGIGLVLIVALFGIFSALGQMFLMIIRVGMLVLLAGMLPLSAAAAVSKGGKEWFTKTLGWLLAFLAYKPAAAIIYATAFAMVGKGDSATSVLSGLFLIALSILALPALLRLAVPVTAAIAGGAAGAGAGAVSAGGAVATGAIQMRATKTGMSGPSGGASRPSGPTGSPNAPGAGRTGGGQGATPGQQGGHTGTASPSKAVGASAGKAGAGAAAAGPVGAGIAAGTQAVQGGINTARNAAGEGPTGSSAGGQQQ